MSDISSAELKKKIIAILEAADLSVLTSKSVRGELERDIGCSLVTRKKEIDEILLEEINKKNDDSSSDSDDEDKNKSKDSEESVSEEKPPKKKRAATTRKTPAKRKRKNVTGTESDSDDGSDEDYKQAKKPAAKKGKASNGPKKGNGFTRPYDLSPQLSALMGANSLPRHAVVKKIWSIIKERNLYDPNNKQFAICDDELMAIMKVKRFRTFGMLKYLKPHFIN